MSGDIVIEQNETAYDAASNVTGTVRLLRFHDVTGTGPLGGPSGSPASRNIYGFRWTDGIGRLVAGANYGTNGGTEPSRPGSIPPSTSGVLVEQVTYNAAGLASSTVNPLGVENRTEYDAMGRRLKFIENYIDGIPDGASDRTTQYAYTLDGQLELLTLQNSVTGTQITRWEYGTTLADSGVASNVLLRAKIFPDSDDASDPLSDGADGIYDRIEYGYNRLGQTASSKDQNGTVHQFGYDGRGRQTTDRVATLGTGVDGAVRRIETAYDNLDHITRVTSYDAATGGSVVNQIERTYDPFGQLKEDRQAHAGTAGTGTPFLAYLHGDGTGNTARLEEIIYPDGRTLRLGYGAANDSGDWLSRVEGVEDVTTSMPWDVARYDYLGVDTAVVSAYPEPDVKLTYVKQPGEADGPAGDRYAGIDRFGRIIDHRWIRAGADVERLKYGYNRAGLREWRLDTLAHDADENQDNHYTYDGLAQVTARDQGQLADGSGAGRHYALCDNMGSKVAITDAGGTVHEVWAGWGDSPGQVADAFRLASPIGQEPGEFENCSVGTLTATGWARYYPGIHFHEEKDELRNLGWRLGNPETLAGATQWSGIANPGWINREKSKSNLSVHSISVKWDGCPPNEHSDTIKISKYITKKK